MPTINKALAILAALAFFFPFITISCNGRPMVEMNGVKLAKCSITTCSADDVLSPDFKAMMGNIPNMNIPGKNGRTSGIDSSDFMRNGTPEGGNFVLFAAITCLVAVLTLFFAGRAGELLSGVSSVAAIGLLVMFRSKFGDAVLPHLHSPEMGAAAALIKIELQFSAGFWMSVILSAVSAILAFKGTGGAPAPVIAGGRGSIGGFVPKPPPGPSGSQLTSACPACGAGNSPGNRFCLSCGGSLTQAASPEKTGSKSATTCPSCGVGAVPGGKFCLSCGASLVALSPAVKPAEPTVVIPADTTDPAPEPAARAAAAAAAPTAQPLPATIPEPQKNTAGPQPPGSPMDRVAQAASAVSSVESSAVAPVESSAVSSKQVCSSCGAEVTSSQKFCLVCGTPVSRIATLAAPTTHPFPGTVQEPTTDREAPPSAVTPRRVCPACGAAFTPEQTSCLVCGRSVSQPKSEIWIVAVVLLAVMGGAGYFVWRHFAGPDVTVTTFQKKIHVAAGGRTSLQASVSGSTNTDVDWSIEEGSKGGNITSAGSMTEQGQSHAAATYTAPQASGTFHVIAASHANPSRTAKVEIVVGGASQPEPAAAPTPAPPASVSANPASTRILGVWRGPSSDMKTAIGADSTITMTSDAAPQKDLSGTYRFLDNSHLEINFGNGDVRKWEIMRSDNTYLLVSAQSKDGATAMVFTKLGN